MDISTMVKDEFKKVFIISVQHRKRRIFKTRKRQQDFIMAPVVVASAAF